MCVWEGGGLVGGVDAPRFEGSAAQCVCVEEGGGVSMCSYFTRARACVCEKDCVPCVSVYTRVHALRRIRQIMTWCWLCGSFLQGENWRMG